MARLHLHRPVLAAIAFALAGACGAAGSPSAVWQSASLPSPGLASAALRDWPEFGLDPQRSNVSLRSTGITAANVAGLRRRTIALPGTVDSSPIYLHGIGAGGAARDVIVVSTTYGRTLALDAASGQILWTFTPDGYERWAGSAQITTTSPLADPDRAFVYTASPDGRIHKLALSDGHEVRSAGWPATVTRDATHEKLAAALNIAGRYLVAATGGYFGDAPPYQGHVVLLDRLTGRIHAVFNTLCAGRRGVIAPSSCAASDSAILSRSGAVIEPGGRRLLLATGNGPWNGATNFGDSVLELTLPALALRQAYTPTDQRHLNEGDTDLGSSGPALLGHGRAAVAGKDGLVRLLSLSRLDGRPPRRSRETLGGELQLLPTPGSAESFATPAVWHTRAGAVMFLADSAGTAAFQLRSGRLHLIWRNGTPGTSPVMAGGLLYVYDPAGGGIAVYRPQSGRPIARLPGSPGHWNSPIVVDGHVVEPEGDANAHRLSGSLEIFSTH